MVRAFEELTAVNRDKEARVAALQREVQSLREGEGDRAKAQRELEAKLQEAQGALQAMRTMSGTGRPGAGAHRPPIRGSEDGAGSYAGGKGPPIQAGGDRALHGGGERTPPWGHQRPRDAHAEVSEGLRRAEGRYEAAREELARAQEEAFADRSAVAGLEDRIAGTQAEAEAAG